MAASSSSSSSLKKYDVFISFRGEDTRQNFTSHLCHALKRKQIITYIDENNLEKGDEISDALNKKAIQQSKISLVVFSENYASSTWCLDELNHILDCMEKYEQIVVPIFYKVDPSHTVRRQQGLYETAFAAHEKRFKDTIKVQKWKDSLTRAANLSGWHSSGDRSESKLVEEIVNDVLDKLDCMSPSTSSYDLKDLVGMNKQLEQVESLLQIGSQNVRIVGIWGMGGIGKTTLSQVIFDRFASQFEGCCFLFSIAKKSKEHHLVELRKELISKVLNDKIHHVNQFAEDRLRRTKVLIVLDDVDDAQQLEKLAGEHSWYGLGSRIVITTRDVHMLNTVGADGIYKVEELNFEDALQLFYLKAFRGNTPTKTYERLSRKMVSAYAKGVPLAVNVLGRHLCSKSTEEWESEFEKLERFPNENILNVLKISYDGLSNNVKDIFLDIACFFVEKTDDFVKRILDACHVGVVAGIRDLIDKSLIAISGHKEILMHDLIRDMGHEIVCRQSKNKLGKYSRLWSTGDVCNVLQRNCGTSKVEGMSLDMTRIQDDLHLKPWVFEEMCNLKFLNFHGFKCKVYFREGLWFLPDTLRYLHWDCFPLKSLPLNFTPKTLVELNMYSSQLKELWNEVKHFDNLKVLNLWFSESLIHVNLSHAPNLEEINLSFCSSMNKFPILPNPNKIKSLNLAVTAIEEVPSSIESLSCLTKIKLDGCRSLRFLPTSICKLRCLSLLSLARCSELAFFPEILEPMECLEELSLIETGIRELPLSIKNLIGLKTLTLHFCDALEVVPYTIYNMRLEYLNLYCCRKLKSLPELPFSIKHLDASECTSLERVSNPWIVLTQFSGDNVIRQQFVFYNCSKLNQNNMVTEFQIRVLGSPPKSAFESQELKSHHFRCVGICFPGDEIPRWFNPQCEGSSIKMKLDPGWYNGNFMGFALCAVISLETNFALEVDLLCELCFETKLGESRIKTQQSLNIRTNKHLAHVVAWSFDGDYSDVSGAVEVSFEFYCHKGRGIFIGNEVKRCGIRRLFLQDAEDFRIANRHYSHEESNAIINKT